MAPNYTQYDEQTLSVACPVCRAMAGEECAVGGEKMPFPHAQRVDLAYSPVWYCAACDVKTTRQHIVNVLNEPERIGTCKATAEIPEEPPEDTQPPPEHSWGQGEVQ